MASDCWRLFLGSELHREVGQRGLLKSGTRRINVFGLGNPKEDAMAVPDSVEMRRSKSRAFGMERGVERYRKVTRLETRGT